MTDNEDLRDELVPEDGLSDDENKLLQDAVKQQDSIALPEELLEEKEVRSEESTSEEEGGDLRTKIASMQLPEKLKLSMFGNATCRSLLINDANKVIQLAVLKNPKLKLAEVEEFSKNPNLSDLVLRKISNTKQWMKSYTIKLNLVSNPKTPQDVSLKWIKYLRASDLKKLSKSKNVPNVVAVMAKKRVSHMQQKGRG